MNLTIENGIDILGNILESSIISPNRNLYGDLHNFGHIAISFAHDPDARHLESFGVMGDSTTAMRDPVFYRWHAFTDDIFQVATDQMHCSLWRNCGHKMAAPMVLHPQCLLSNISRPLASDTS